MKRRTIDKEKAISLRLQGWSYNQIKNELVVGKGTLSAWLREYPLSEKRIRELRDWNQIRIERYRETRRKNKERILNEVYADEKRKIIPLSQRDLFVAGLFLYWGEGGKTKESELILSNTNPTIIKFFVYWLRRSLKVPSHKIKFKMHLYKDMDVKKEINYWAKILHVKKDQFIKPYIKESTLSSITYKKGFGYGTCNVAVSNAILAKRILMGLRVIEDHFNHYGGA